MSRSTFHNNFGYGSFLPLVLIILGNYIILLLLNERSEQAIFVMLISFATYIINNIFVNYYEMHNNFDEFLENIAVFLNFGVSTVVLGILKFSEEMMVLTIILFYSVCICLSLARNKISELKNSNGWPIALNGLFFPLIFFFNEFYLGDVGNAIFIIFYITISILSVSSYNFLGHPDNKDENDNEIKSFKEIPNQNIKEKTEI